MPTKYIPRDGYESDKTKNYSESKYYRKLGFKQLSNGDWVCPRQKMGIVLRHVLV